MYNGDIYKGTGLVHTYVQVSSFPVVIAEVTGFQDGAATGKADGLGNEEGNLVVAGIDIRSSPFDAREEVVYVGVHLVAAITACPWHNVHGFESEAHACCGPVLKIRQGEVWRRRDRGDPGVAARGRHCVESRGELVMGGTLGGATIMQPFCHCL
jgi:hypothetical protein